MKKTFLLLITMLFYFSCERTECCSKSIIGLSGRYIHEIPNCDGEGNPEINCTEWLEFVSGSEVDILYGGGDIVQRFTYSQDADSIALEGPSTSSFRPSFCIKDELTLERKDNGDIWTKRG